MKRVDKVISIYEVIMTYDQLIKIAELAKKFYELGQHNIELFDIYDQMFESLYNENIRQNLLKQFEKFHSFELLEYIEILNKMTLEEIAGTFGYIKALRDINPSNN
jgi:hypothetical protein